MKKIYCKNCEYSGYDENGFLICFPEDLATASKVCKNKGYNPNHIEFPIAANAFGRNCQFYKRKWYKFWAE